jgi:hypothetical protein
VFNVADSAVSVGVLLFAFTWGGHREEHAAPTDAGAALATGTTIAETPAAPDISPASPATDPDDIADAPSADARS